jgi:hypothetical protein
MNLNSITVKTHRNIDLTNLAPREQTKIQLSNMFAVDKLNPKISKSDAEHIIFEYIQKANRMEFENVVNTKLWSAIRYVPKWLVNFKTKSNIYLREILATSGMVVIDDTSVCKSDSHLNKKSYPTTDGRKAICKICGKIFCRFHIFRRNDLCLCQEHQNNSQISCLSSG